MPYPAGPEQVRAIYSQLHIRIQKYRWIYSVSKLIYFKVLSIRRKYSIDNNSFTFCAFYCFEKVKWTYSLKFSVLGVQQIPLHRVSLSMRTGANTLLEDDRGCVPDVTWGFLTGLPVTLHRCQWSCLSVHHQLWRLTGRHCADLALPLSAPAGPGSKAHAVLWLPAHLQSYDLVLYTLKPKHHLGQQAPRATRWHSKKKMIPAGTSCCSAMG